MDYFTTTSKHVGAIMRNMLAGVNSGNMVVFRPIISSLDSE